jgi:hypothetical protein
MIPAKHTRVHTTEHQSLYYSSTKIPAKEHHASSRYRSQRFRQQGTMGENSGFLWFETPPEFQLYSMYRTEHQDSWYRTLQIGVSATEHKSPARNTVDPGKNTWLLLHEVKALRNRIVGFQFQRTRIGDHNGSSAEYQGSVLYRATGFL